MNSTEMAQFLADLVKTGMTHGHVVTSYTVSESTWNTFEVKYVNSNRDAKTYTVTVTEELTSSDPTHGYGGNM